MRKLSLLEVYDAQTGKPRPSLVMSHFVREGRLEEEAALALLNEAAGLLRAEQTMIEVEAPVTGNYGRRRADK